MAAKKDQSVGIRISSESIAWIDELATESGLKRSAMIRKLLREAVVARIQAKQAK